jgi:hypothetical protein
MIPLDLNINLVNPALHEKPFEKPFGYLVRGHLRVFRNITEWRDHLLKLQIRGANVPDGFVKNYHVALRMMLLAWVDESIIKLAEFQALRILEAALIAAYKKQLKPKSRSSFSDLISFAIESDDLPKSSSSLPKIRNDLAHGDIFILLPWDRLFESVRDVMEHAYRHNANHPTL